MFTPGRIPYGDRSKTYYPSRRRQYLQPFIYPIFRVWWAWPAAALPDGYRAFATQ